MARDTASAVRILCDLVERLVIGGKWPRAEAAMLLQQIDDCRALADPEEEA